MKGKYAQTYKEMIAETTYLDFSSCNYTSALPEITATIDACKHQLRVLDLSRNPITGTLFVLNTCVNLEVLKLEKCDKINGKVHFARRA